MWGCDSDVVQQQRILVCHLRNSVIKMKLINGTCSSITLYTVTSKVVVNILFI